MFAGAHNINIIEFHKNRSTGGDVLFIIRLNGRWRCVWVGMIFTQEPMHRVGISFRTLAYQNNTTNLI